MNGGRMQRARAYTSCRHSSPSRADIAHVDRCLSPSSCTRRLRGDGRRAKVQETRARVITRMRTKPSHTRRITGTEDSSRRRLRCRMGLASRSGLGKQRQTGDVRDNDSLGARRVAKLRGEDVKKIREVMCANDVDAGSGRKGAMKKE